MRTKYRYTTPTTKRWSWLLSSVTLRIIFALLLGFLFVLAFFGTNALSH